MFEVVDFGTGSDAGISADFQHEVTRFWDFMWDCDGSSFTMVTGWSSLPDHGEHDHFGCIQDTETEEMVVFEADSIHLPFEVGAVGDFGKLVVAMVVIDVEDGEVTATTVEEGVAGTGEDRQVLEIPPCKVGVGFKGEGEDTGGFGGCCGGTRVAASAPTIEICGSDTGFGVAASVREGRGDGRGTAFIVVGIFAVIDGGVDGDGPHGCGVSIAVAVIVFATVTAGPDKDGAEPIAALIDALDDGAHGGISRSIDGFAIIGGSPGGGVNVDEIGFMSHGVGFNEIGHVGLIEHPNSRYLGVVRDTDTADTIVTGGRDFTRASGSMGIEPIIGVPRIWVGIIGGEVIGCFGVEVVLQIGMHVIDSIIHDGGGNIFAGESHGPCQFDIEIEAGLATRLTSIFEVPLIGVQGIGRGLNGGEIELFLESFIQWPAKRDRI